MIKLFKNCLLIFVTILAFAGCNNKLKVSKIETSNTQLNKNSEEDKEFLDVINPFKIQIDAEMNAILIVSEAEATKGQPEGELGNLVADIVLKKTRDYTTDAVDICMLNNGGLRTSLPKGDIILGKVFELMPFENEMVLLTLSGKQTRQLFNYIGRSGGVPLAGATATITDTNIVDIKINNKPFDEGITYNIVTSDYLAGGGDKMRFFNNPVNYKPIKHKLRDALVEYMIEENKKGNTLKPKKDGRLTKK